MYEQNLWVIYGPVHLSYTLSQSRMLVGTLGRPTVLKKILKIHRHLALSESLCHSSGWWAVEF